MFGRCEEIEMDLSDALDGALEPSRAQALETHLEDCPACRRAQRGLARTVGLLRLLGRRRASP